MATPEEDLAELDRMMGEAYARGEIQQPPRTTLEQQSATSKAVGVRNLARSQKQAVRDVARATPETVSAGAAQNARDMQQQVVTTRDVLDMRPRTLTFREAVNLSRKPDYKPQRFADVARRIEQGEPPEDPTAGIANRMVTVGPLGLGGVQVQDAGNNTVGQLAPDEDVDISKVEGPWHSKVAPVLLGQADLLQQGVTQQVLRRIYDPTTGKWLEKGPDVPFEPSDRETSPRMESVRGLTNYGEAVAHRAAGAAPELAAGMSEAASMMLAAPAAVAAGWNRVVEAPVSDWARRQADIYYASEGTTPETSPSEDYEQADAWWQAAKDLAGGLSGAMEGAQIPQSEKQGIAQDYGSLLGRTAGTAAALKAPTSAAVGGGALKLAGAGVRKVGEKAVELAARSPKMHTVARMFDDTPTLITLPTEVADTVRMAQSMDAAEPLNRSIRYQRALDSDLSGAAWWDAVPAPDRARLLTGVEPKTPQGKAAWSILREAGDAQHSVQTMNAASAEAQDAIRRTAGTLQDIRATGLQPGVTPAAMHPMHGQDISQASGDLSTLQQRASGRMGQATPARPDEFAASPAGEGLQASGKAALVRPREAAAAELAAQESAAVEKLGIPEEAVPGFQSMRDRAARLRAGTATDADFAGELAKKMRGTHSAARRYDEALGRRARDTQAMATGDRAAMDAMSRIDEGRLRSKAAADTAAQGAKFNAALDESVKRVAQRTGLTEDQVRRVLDEGAGGADTTTAMPPAAMDPRASQVARRFEPGASGDIMEAQARRTEDLLMDRLKVPKERREEVRRLARAAQVAEPRSPVLSQSWREYLQQQGVNPDTAENELGRRFTAATLRAARKAEKAPEYAMPGVDLMEGHSAATTRKALMDQATSLPGKFQLREIKKLERELSASNLVSGALKTAKSTSSLTGKRAYFSELNRAAQAGRRAMPGMFERPDQLKLANAFDEAPARVNYVGKQTGAVDLTPEAAKDLGLDANTVLIRVLGKDQRAVSDFSKGGFILNLSPPPGVDAAAFHNMKVPRSFAQALVDYENPMAQSKLAAGLDFFLSTPQVTRAMTVGRSGFQATNLTNESMRAMAAEPDLLKSGVIPEVGEILTAADNAPTQYGMTAGQLRERMVAGVGAGRGWYSGVARATEDAPAFEVGHEIGRALRAAGQTRTGTAIEKATGAFDTAVEAMNKPGMAVNSAAERAWMEAFGFKQVDGFSAEDQLRMALMLRKMKRGVSPEAAARETNIILINFADKNWLQRNAQWAIPFAKYYTGSFRGALGIAARNPQQYRHLYQFMVAQEEADSVANRAAGRRINQKFKTPEQHLAFRALTQDGESFKASGADYPTAEFAQLVESAQRFLPSEEGQRSALALANPILTQLATQMTAVDPASGRHVLGLTNPDDRKDVAAAAARLHPILSMINAPAAQAMVMRDDPRLTGQGGWQLGENPDAAVALQVMRYTPVLSRLMNQPQAAMLARWASGMRGNNPAALTEESRDSEVARALAKAILGARTEAVDPVGRATASNRRVADEVVSPVEIRKRNALRAGKPVKERQ